MDHPTAPTTAIRKSSQAHQQNVDEMIAAVRNGRPGPRPSIFKPAPPKPEPSTRLLDHRIAEELEYVGRRLEHLGNVLSEDGILLIRHSASLQSIDLMKQILGQLARVVAAQDKEAVADLITLTELKGRLVRKALRPLTEDVPPSKQ
jgi:hypothetical protein